MRRSIANGASNRRPGWLVATRSISRSLRRRHKSHERHGAQYEDRGQKSGRPTHQDVPHRYTISKRSLSIALPGTPACMSNSSARFIIGAGPQMKQ